MSPIVAELVVKLIQVIKCVLH